MIRIAMVISTLFYCVLAIFPVQAWDSVTVRDGSGPITNSSLEVTTGTLFVPGAIAIGTASPSEALEIFGNGQNLKLTRPNGDYVQIGGGNGVITRVATTGSLVIDIDPRANDGVSDATIRIGRTTQTTGQTGIQFMKGNNTGAYQHFIRGNGDTIFNERGQAWDFRIEGDTDANLFKVIGAQDQISIGAATVNGSFKLQVQTDLDDVLRLESSDGVARLAIVDPNGSSWLGTRDGKAFWGTDSILDSGKNLVVTPNGDVGVGVTSPAQKFHVNGTILATDLITTNDLDADTLDGLGSASFLRADAPTTATAKVDLAGGVGVDAIQGLSGASALEISGADVVMPGVLAVLRSGASPSTGTLGIGIGSPTALLHIKGYNNDNAVMIESTETLGSPVIGFYQAQVGSAKPIRRGFIQLDSGLSTVTRTMRLGSESGGIDLSTNGGGTVVDRLSISANGDIELYGDATFHRTLIAQDTVTFEDSAMIEKEFTANSSIAINGGYLKIKTTNTTPTAVANHANLFVLGSGVGAEMYAQDGNNNVTQLTSHAFSLFVPDPSIELPWSFHHSNLLIGKRCEVDMAGLVQAVEGLTGRQFAYYEALPPGQRVSLEQWFQDQDEHETAELKQAFLRRHPRIEADRLDAIEWIEIKTRVQSISTVPRTVYDLDRDTGELISHVEMVEVKNEREIGTGQFEWRTKAGYRFDRLTGKFIRRRTLEDVTEADIAPMRSPQSPEPSQWVLDRIVN